MFRERKQQEVEHTEREPHEDVLHRMQQRESEELPHEEDEKRQDDEEKGVLHGPFALLIDVDRPTETDTERRSLRLRRQLLAIGLIANPVRWKRAPEIGHVPLRGETGRAGGPRLRQ